MPKKKKGSKKQRFPLLKKIGKFQRDHVFLFVLAYLLVIFGLYQGWRQIRIYQERKDFQTAEMVVSELVDNIQAKLGKTEVEEHKQCSYGTVKLEKQNLNCDIRYRFGYIVSKARSAQDKAKIFSKVLSDNQNVSVSYKDKLDFSNIVDKYRSVLEVQDYKSNFQVHNANQITCGAIGSYSDNAKTNIERFSISIICRSPDGTLTNYYPLIN